MSIWDKKGVEVDGKTCDTKVKRKTSGKERSKGNQRDKG